MGPNTVSTPLAPGAIGPYSQGKAAHGFIFVSGQLPLDPETGIMPKDIQDQTIQSMKNILAIVKAAGGSEKSIVRCGIFVRDMERFGDINAAYAQFFEEPYPARAAFQVAKLPKDALIEIEAIAVK